MSKLDDTFEKLKTVKIFRDCASDSLVLQKMQNQLVVNTRLVAMAYLCLQIYKYDSPVTEKLQEGDYSVIPLLGKETKLQEPLTLLLRLYKKDVAKKESISIKISDENVEKLAISLYRYIRAVSHSLGVNLLRSKPGEDEENLENEFSPDASENESEDGVDGHRESNSDELVIEDDDEEKYISK
jgi:hypothetical protein